MGPIWGRQDPGGPHVGPMNFSIWDDHNATNLFVYFMGYTQHGTAKFIFGKAGLLSGSLQRSCAIYVLNNVQIYCIIIMNATLIVRLYHIAWGCNKNHVRNRYIGISGFKI